MADAEAMDVDEQDTPSYPRSGMIFEEVIAGNETAYDWLRPQLEEAGVKIRLKDERLVPVPDEMWVLQQIVKDEAPIWDKLDSLVQEPFDAAEPAADSLETWSSKWEPPEHMLGIRLMVTAAPSVDEVEFNQLKFWNQVAYNRLKVPAKKRREFESSGYKFKLGQGAYARTKVPTTSPVGWADDGRFQFALGTHSNPNYEEGMVMGQITGFTIDALYDWTNGTPMKGAVPPPFKEVSIVVHLQSAACEFLLVRRTVEHGTEPYHTSHASHTSHCLTHRLLCECVY